MTDKIILLDANSLIHRAYHALPNLKSRKGQYTGAIYGFLSILLRLIKEQNPTHIAAAFDLKAPTFRHKMYAEYKAGRKPMDEELRSQFEPLKELLAAMGVKIVSLEGYEADDILGTLAKRFDCETIIVTGDRDSFQLADESTRIFWTKRGVTDIEVYDLDKLKEEGFTPSTYIDYKALRGDASDNIPGVSGVGEKTAKQLLADYGTLDAVLDNAANIKGKLGQTLGASREIAELSRVLSVIDVNVPVECTLDDIAFTPVFSGKVRNMLSELDMDSLIKRMAFSEDGEDSSPSVEPTVEKTVIETDNAEEALRAINGDAFAVIFGEDVRISGDGKTEYVIKTVRDLFGGGADYEDVLSKVGKLAREKLLICYDVKSLYRKHNIAVPEFFDVMIAAHLSCDSAPVKNIATVIGEDGGAAELYRKREEYDMVLHNKNLTKLFYDVEQPLALILAKMEERGFTLSSRKLEELKEKYGAILEGLTRDVYAAAGESFNIASTKQLGEILFEKLGLPHGKKTKTGYSVSEDTLSKIKDKHPVVELILKWRHYAKLLSTYINGLQPLISGGKIHTEFNQCVTLTGRLSSANPNLQNIPVRGEEAKDVKSAFTASAGNVLVSADYSQIELRLLAVMSGDSKLIEAYNRAEDIHTLTASQIFGVPQDEVTPAMRRDAKAVNFGIVYGISDFGLSENLSIPKYAAKEFIERYFLTYPTVKDYLERNVSEARERGYTLTYLGRRRDASDLKSSNYLIRSAAERIAMNTPLQGSAADVVKLAMIAVEKRLENMKSKMILQVHDELIVDAAADEVDAVKRILKEEMEGAVSFSVPLIAEVSAANDWGSLK